MTDEQNKTEDAALHPLLKLARNKKTDELELAWMEEIEKGAKERNILFRTARYVADNMDRETAGTMLWMLVNAFVEKNEKEKALDLAREAVFITPNFGDLRDTILMLYEELHSEQELLAKFLSASGLEEKTPMNEAIPILDRMLELTPGTYVTRKSSNVPGKVEKFDTDAARLLVTFKKKETALEPSELPSLEILPRDDFRARFEFEPSALAEVAEARPAELAKSVLEAFGMRMEYKDLKTKLSPDVIPRNKWNAWWTATHKLLARDPMITMTDDKQPYIVLRKTAISLEEKTRMKFVDDNAPEDVLRLVLEYLSVRDKTGELKPEFVEELHVRVQEIAIGKNGILGLAALAVEEKLESELGGGPEFPDAKTLASRVADFSETSEVITDNGILSMFLDYVKTAIHEEWPDIWSKIFLGLKGAAASDIVKVLLDSDNLEKAREAVVTTLMRPFQYPYALTWIWKNFRNSRFAELLGDLDEVRLAVTVIRTAESLTRLADNRVHLREPRSALVAALSQKNAAQIREIAENTDVEGARKMKRAIESATSLKPEIVETVTSPLRTHHWEIFEKKLDPWEDGYIYSSPEALENKRDEFQELVTVKMADNAKAIGKAAELGDISDNADFRVALQERDLLAERAAKMQDELEKARPIDPGSFEENRIGIGSKIEVEFLDTGEKKVLLFLGPWDTDAEKGIYSYMAPLGMAFMGREIGEEVDIPSPGGEKRVKILSNTFFIDT